MENLVNSLDVNTWQLLYSLRSPWLTELLFFFSRMGDDVIAYPAVLLVTGVWWKLLSKKHALFFLCSMMVSAVSNTLIKEVVARPRPLLDPLLIRTDFSFPSGHAMNSVVFFGLVALFSLQLIAQRWQRILVILFSVLIPLLMGVSRVYLGVHHASDVMVGFILGSLIMMGASRIFKKFKLNSRQPGQKDHSV